MDSGRKRKTVPWTYSPHSATYHKLHFTIFILWLLHHSQAQKTQSPLQEKGIEIKHQIGTNAVMTCTVAELGARRIIWSKLADPYPISVGNTLFNPNKKYKVEVTNNQSVLTVKNVKLEDAGEYQCRVSGQVYHAETLTLNIQAATGNTYLLKSETEILGEIGGTVVLPCMVENIQNNLVLWKNSQNDILSLRRKVYNDDSRLAVQHNTRPEWSLQIKNLRPSDFGLYTCIINSQPVLTRTVLLKNITPDQSAPVLLQDNTFKKRLEVKSGETVNLTCNFKSSPPAKVTWYRRKIENGKSVKDALGQGNTYTMRSVSPEQGGQYICNGDNGVKPVGRGKIQLTVLAPPTAAPVLAPTTFIAVGPIAPVMYRDQERVGQRRGRDAHLKCMAIGNPRPEIHWLWNGNTIDEKNARYKITVEHHRHDITNSALAVRHMLDRDNGEYTCRGYNKFGLSSIAIELYTIE